MHGVCSGGTGFVQQPVVGSRCGDTHAHETHHPRPTRRGNLYAFSNPMCLRHTPLVPNSVHTLISLTHTAPTQTHIKHHTSHALSADLIFDDTFTLKLPLLRALSVAFVEAQLPIAGGPERIQTQLSITAPNLIPFDHPLLCGRLWVALLELQHVARTVQARVRRDPQVQLEQACSAVQCDTV